MVISLSMISILIGEFSVRMFNETKCTLDGSKIVVQWHSFVYLHRSI